MGLDIAFNRKAALEAGLVIKTLDNGTEDEIAEAIQDDLGAEYIEYLRGQTNCIVVPDAEHLVADDGCEENIIVRANKWGHTYAPLTAWLTANNITWTEF